jgi:signal transduction histidine kinase
VLFRSKITQDPEGWVRQSLADGLPCIRTSPDMLTEAFRVIIKNSVEAMSERGGERWLTIESRPAKEGWVEVLIKDNGTGIKKENLSRIFEMRWTTKSAGLGFGLFWAKDYIEGLGGRIMVESVWQKGTTFRITLPAPGETKK